MKSKRKIGFVFPILSVLFACHPFDEPSSSGSFGESQGTSIPEATLKEEKGLEQTFFDYPLDYMESHDPGFAYRREHELWPAQGAPAGGRNTYLLEYGAFEENYYFVYMDVALADEAIALVKQEYRAGPEDAPHLFNSFYFGEDVVDGKAVRGYQLKVERENASPDLGNLSVYSYPSLEGIPSQIEGKKLVMVSKRRRVTLKEDLLHKKVLDQALPFYVRISTKPDGKGGMETLENKRNDTYRDDSENMSQTFFGQAVESMDASLEAKTAVYSPSLIWLGSMENRVYLPVVDQQGKEGFSLPIGIKKNDGTYVDYFDAATVEKDQGNPFVRYKGYFTGHFAEFKDALLSQKDGASDDEGTQVDGFFDKEKVLAIIRSASA